MTPSTLERQLAFLKEIDRLKSIVRLSPLIDRSRRENSAEHSWHLAMYALVLAERLRREISDQPLAGLDITASFGVASFRGVGDTTDQLFGRADMAMYEAKRSGRNAVR